MGQIVGVVLLVAALSGCAGQSLAEYRQELLGRVQKGDITAETANWLLEKDAEDREQSRRLWRAIGGGLAAAGGAIPQTPNYNAPPRIRTITCNTVYFGNQARTTCY